MKKRNEVRILGPIHFSNKFYSQGLHRFNERKEEEKESIPIIIQSWTKTKTTSLFYA